MALKISLKPNEKIVVNGAVIANGDRPAQLHFLNNARFLREKDIVQENEVERDEDYPYFLIQLMYIDSDNSGRYRLQLDMALDALAKAHPDKQESLDGIRDMVDSMDIYQALKECRKVFPVNEVIKEDEVTS